MVDRMLNFSLQLAATTERTSVVKKKREFTLFYYEIVDIRLLLLRQHLYLTSAVFCFGFAMIKDW